MPTLDRVPMYPGKSWNLRKEFYRPGKWKVMENDCGHGNSWKSHGIPPISVEFFNRRIIILGV